jgi:guanylate kinase
MDHPDYQPAPHVLDRLRQVDFIAVVGPTSVGKTTVIKAAMAMEPSLHLVLNNTSRAPRAGEQEGVDYQFRTRQEMEQRIARREYVQVAPSVLGELYATPPEGYFTDGVCVMAVLADAMPNFHALPFKRLRTIFIVPPNWQTWEKRLTAHNFTPEHRAKRLAEAKRSLEFAISDEQPLIIINQDLHTAAQDFIDIALDRPLPPRLESDQGRGRDIVRTLLSHLEEA